MMFKPKEVSLHKALPILNQGNFSRQANQLQQRSHWVRMRKSHRRLNPFYKTAKRGYSSFPIWRIKLPV
jgi:hypothetical protein